MRDHGRTFARNHPCETFANPSRAKVKSNVDGNGDTFDARDFTVFPLGTPISQTLQGSIARQELSGKKESLKEALVKVRKRPWYGAMTDLHSTPPTSQDVKNQVGFPEAPELLSHDGGQPWLMGVKKHAPRFGGAHTSLPGVGQLWTISDAHVFLLAVNMKHLGSQGIALANLANFMDTETGVSFMADPENAILFPPVEAGSVVWVPYGWTMTPIYLPPKPPSQFPEVVFITMLPIFVADLAASADGWDYVKGHNTGIFAEKADSARMWMVRSKAFNDFCSKVEECQGHR